MTLDSSLVSYGQHSPASPKRLPFGPRLLEFFEHRHPAHSWQGACRRAVNDAGKRLDYCGYWSDRLLLWDDTSASTCLVMGVRDANLGRIATKVVIVFSITAELVEPLQGTDEPPRIALRQTWEVVDGFSLSSTQSATREHRPWKNQTLFGSGEVLGTVSMPVSGLDFRNELYDLIETQLEAWPVTDSIDKVWDVVLNEVGASGSNKVDPAVMAERIPALLEGTEAFQQADLALNEFEVQAYARNLGLSNPWKPQELKRSRDGQGRMVFEKADLSELLEGGEMVRYIQANWWMRWSEDTQQLDATLSVHVQTNLDSPGLYYVLELPPLNLSSKTIQREGRLTNWVQSLDVSAAEHQAELAKLVELADLELVP